MRNKKGLTLVEIVVALGILMVVFTGSIILVVQVTRSALRSRDITTASALAQRGLTEKISEVGFGCGASSPVSGNYSYPLNGLTYDVNVNVETATYAGGALIPSVSGDYYYLTATVLKGGETLFVARQVMEKPDV